jgi:hypothetical protein
LIDYWPSGVEHPVQRRTADAKQLRCAQLVSPASCEYIEYMVLYDVVQSLHPHLWIHRRIDQCKQVAWLHDRTFRQRSRLSDDTCQLA